MTKPQYGWVVKAAVLSIIVIEYTIGLQTPVLGAIAQAFPDVSQETIKLIQTLPNLMMVIVAALAGTIQKYVSKRVMLLTAAVLMFAAGLAPALGGDIGFILVCRGLFGMGRGIVFPFAMSMIVDLFDGKERNILMGYRSSVGSIAGIVFMQIGGFLGTMNWRFAFWGFLLAIPFILLIYFKLPEPEKQTIAVKEDGTKQSMLTTKTWYMIILNFVFITCAYSMFTNTAIAITFMELGTPATAGMVLSTFTLASAFTGILYGKAIRPAFKRYTVVVGLLFVGGGLSILGFYATNLSHFFIGAAIFGIGFSIYNTDQFLNVPATARSAAAALSMFMALNGLGSFASPIVLKALMNMFGFEGPQAAWTIAGPAIIVGAILTIFVKALVKPKEALQE